LHSFIQSINQFSSIKAAQYEKSAKSRYNGQNVTYKDTKAVKVYANKTQV